MLCCLSSSWCSCRSDLLVRPERSSNWALSFCHRLSESGTGWAVDFVNLSQHYQRKAKTNAKFAIVLKRSLTNFLRESNWRNHWNDSRCDVFFKRRNWYNPAAVAHSFDANHHQKKPADLISPGYFPENVIFTETWKKNMKKKMKKLNEESVLNAL